MTKRRDVSLDEYGLSKWRYRELRYFCLQYPEKKHLINKSSHLSAVNYSDMPKSGNVSSPTENQALKILELKKDIELIEQTAIEADSGIYQYIIQNVTEDLPYEYMPVPCGRRYFYNARRKFFYLLSKKK